MGCTFFAYEYEYEEEGRGQVNLQTRETSVDVWCPTRFARGSSSNHMPGGPFTDGPALEGKHHTKPWTSDHGCRAAADGKVEVFERERREW